MFSAIDCRLLLFRMLFSPSFFHTLLVKDRSFSKGEKRLARSLVASNSNTNSNVNLDYRAIQISISEGSKGRGQNSSSSGFRGSTLASQGGTDLGEDQSVKVTNAEFRSTCYI